jgi:hypothetical protein
MEKPPQGGFFHTPLDRRYGDAGSFQRSSDTVISTAGGLGAGNDGGGFYPD